MIETYTYRVREKIPGNVVYACPNGQEQAQHDEGVANMILGGDSFECASGDLLQAIRNADGRAILLAP